MRVAIVSPHLDDGVFSVVENMLSRPDNEYVIVCPLAGIPEDAAGRAKYLTLHAEHDDVVGSLVEDHGLDVDVANGPFLDDVYGPQDPAALNRWMVGELTALGADQWWVPAGIHHPDHLSVAATAGAVLANQLDVRRWVYEELPYRVLYPPRPIALPHGAALAGYDPAHLETKKELCRMYHSQIGPDLERCLYVPERLWVVR